MHTVCGKNIGKGIAVGKIVYYQPKHYIIDDSYIEDTEKELFRYETAVEEAVRRENELYQKALQTAGKENAEIFAGHAVMLRDVILEDAVREIIVGQRRRAEYAVSRAYSDQAALLEQMDDPYLRERSADIVEIRQEVLDILSDRNRETDEESEPFILVAEDLLPADTMKWNQKFLRGIVVKGGSTNSHMAILARSMNIPALVQCKEIDANWDGDTAVIDGEHALLYVNPDKDLLQTFEEKQKEKLSCEEQLKRLIGKENLTIDGISIYLYANIKSPDDIAMVKENDAGGIGLYRTEFLYINNQNFPTEEEQFDAYKTVAEAMSPKTVVIRTFDIGADKPAPYMNLAREENPAMGLRAIRISLTHPDFFKTQLRAILRAAAYGKVAVMFPMIISEKELIQAKEMLAECRRELEQEGKKTGDCQVGIMIETPAAVLCADELAQNCDFFSIGTNDLTQYLLAIDRQSDTLEAFVDTHHPAVLRAIRMTVDAGHKNGIPVGICGELAADRSLTELFLQMGVDELSVNPKEILILRDQIRKTDLSHDK